MDRKKVFILDDDPERLAHLVQFAHNLIPGAPHVVIAMDAVSAKEILPTQEWDLLLLDHDLGLYDLNGYGQHRPGNNGTEVSKFIQKNGVKFKLCILHSVNDWGAERMYNNLKGLGGMVKLKPFDTIVGPPIPRYRFDLTTML